MIPIQCDPNNAFCASVKSHFLVRITCIRDPCTKIDMTEQAPTLGRFEYGVGSQAPGGGKLHA